VTVVYENRSVDLAVPYGVQVATLVPELALASGVQVDVAAPRPLSLHRPAHGPIAPEQTLAEAGVVDGDLIVLSAEPVPGPAVVDDLGQAVAAAVGRRPGRWSAEATVAALKVALVAASTAAAITLAARWGAAGSPGVLPFAVTLILFALVSLNVWFEGVRPVAGALALAALPWAALAGPSLAGVMDGANRSGRLALAGAFALAGALIAALLVPPVARLALALALVALAAGVTGAVLWAGRSSEQAGAMLAAGGLVAVLILPRLVTLTSGLPSMDDGSRHDQVEQRVEGARRLLAWLLGAASLVVLAGVVILAVAGRPAGALLAVVVSLLLGLHAGSYRFVAEVVPMLTAAAIGTGVALAVPLARGAGVVPVTLVLVAVALAAAWLAVSGQTRARGVSPTLGKAVELVSLALLLAVAPLTLASLGVFGAARSLAGSMFG
jgi:type VII secretion integral membrane protein EccD